MVERDYLKKHYNNPYRLRSPARHRMWWQRRRGVAFTIMGGIVATLMIRALLIPVESFTVNGVSQDSTQRDIQSFIAQQYQDLSWWHQRFIAYPTVTIIQQLRDRFSPETIAVKRRWRDQSIHVTIALPRGDITLERGKQLFLLDRNGYYIRTLSEKERTAYVIIDASDTIPSFREHIVDASMIKTITTLQSVYEHSPLYHIRGWIVASDPSSDIPLKIKMTDGWELYIRPDDDGHDSFTRLQLFLKSLDSSARKQLHYIDLRFGERLYYK